MWLRSLFNSPKSPTAVTRARRPSDRLHVEALEDRSVPALISDPVGDFLPTYTGPQDAGLDVTAHEVVYLEDQGRLVFFGRMAGPIAPTQALGGLYLIGVDRGQGTPRFLRRTRGNNSVGESSYNATSTTGRWLDGTGGGCL